MVVAYRFTIRSATRFLIISTATDLSKMHIFIISELIYENQSLMNWTSWIMFTSVCLTIKSNIYEFEIL